MSSQLLREEDKTCIAFANLLDCVTGPVAVNKKSSSNHSLSGVAGLHSCDLYGVSALSCLSLTTIEASVVETLLSISYRLKFPSRENCPVAAKSDFSH